MSQLISWLVQTLLIPNALAIPEQIQLYQGNIKQFDVQAHRGGRGYVVENVLPSFAWGLIYGATTLELDNGITKDGHVIVWHDESIVGTKCLDTRPAFPNDPDYPYVGKFIANLTLAQLKMLDCGSQRDYEFPLQLIYPGTRLSTLSELFDFVQCTDPEHKMLFNIESKINPEQPNCTRSVDDFVEKQHEIFVKSPYYKSITYQSFDWRSLVAMKKLDPSIPTAALVDNYTVINQDNSTSAWLAGLRPDSFPGDSIGVQIANAADAIGADIVSPADALSGIDITDDFYVSFTTQDMIERAHSLSRLVKPWTIRLVLYYHDWKVDGLITDYPREVRALAEQNNIVVAPEVSKQRVMNCLEQHLELQRVN